MYLMIFAACALAASDPQPGPAVGSRDSVKQALALLAKMKESRDRLHSGTYKATGRLLTNKRSIGQQQPEGTIEIFAAFELDKGLFRFDRTEPARAPIGGPAIPDRDTRKYVRTPDCTILPQTLWLDESQGFSPIRLSYNIPASEPGQPDQLVSECRVRWKKGRKRVDTCLVPTRAPGTGLS